MEVHKINTTTSPKTIDKDMEVHEYHMWKVHEVNEVSLLKVGCKQVKYKTNTK